MENKEICRLYKQHWNYYRVMCEFMSFDFHPANQVEARHVCSI